jgi:hypothetical protein
MFTIEEKGGAHHALCVVPSSMDSCLDIYAIILACYVLRTSCLNLNCIHNELTTSRGSNLLISWSKWLIFVAKYS